VGSGRSPPTPTSSPRAPPSLLPTAPFAEAQRLPEQQLPAELISDHFAQAHQNRATAAHSSKIDFFTPAATASSTAFYSCSVKSTTSQDGPSSPAAACELVTSQPARQGSPPVRYQALSTGEDVSMSPCALANNAPSQVYSPYVLSSTGVGFDPSIGANSSAARCTT
jgi:hypothetical protein